MDSVIALVPSAGVLLLFVVVIRYFFRADRIERENLERLDRADAERSAPAPEAPAAEESGTR